MDYRINYNFLTRFLKANQEITKKSIYSDCLGIKDATTLNKVLLGKQAYTLEKIIKISNYFQIPIQSWFLDEEGEDTPQEQTIPIVGKTHNSKINYSVNFEFYGEWLKCNHCRAAAIQKCLGIKDYTAVNNWWEGDSFPSMEKIIRISNYFQIPLYCWFLNDGEVVPNMSFRKPTSEDQSIPTGGFYENSSKSGPKRFSPITEHRVESILPEKYKIVNSTKREEKRDKEEQPEEQKNKREETVYSKFMEFIDSIKQDQEQEQRYKEEFEKLEEAHKRELEKLGEAHKRELEIEKEIYKTRLRHQREKYDLKIADIMEQFDNERSNYIEKIKQQESTIELLIDKLKTGSSK